MQALASATRAPGPHRPRATHPPAASDRAKHENTKLFLERCCLPHLAEALAAPPAPPRSALRNQSLTEHFTLCWLTRWSTAAGRRGRAAPRRGRPEDDCHVH